MRAAEVAITPRCSECGDVWLAGALARWRAYRTDVEPDDEPEVAFWCPDCARREFD